MRSWLSGVLISCCCLAGEVSQTGPFANLTDLGIVYTQTAETTPRPLRWHHLKVDLRNPQIELAVITNDDPDGAGPAEATLESPVTMAAKNQALALINTNAFRVLSKPSGDSIHSWYAGQPVAIAGLAASRGHVRSPHAERYAALWFDTDGAPNLAPPLPDTTPAEGTAGFIYILRDGKIQKKQSYGRHPRTAIGIDEERHYLHFLVVDGRQKGFSEGVNTLELARKMRDLGCRTAINLDGGGSSVMVLNNGNGFQQTVNSPSTIVFGTPIPRPIPVALCVRRKAELKIGK